MYKIFFSVRNRLAITIKSLMALKKHSVLDHQIYVYDNLTTHRLDEHFMFWAEMFKSESISQITFTSKESTFNAFSKGTTSNLFGLQHEQDPKKRDFLFLVILDNDMIVTPGWDEQVYNVMTDIGRLGLKNLKIMGQHHNGIQVGYKFPNNLGGSPAYSGKFGGSGFWVLRSDFFDDVGYLKLPQLVGLNKKHDQFYWKRFEIASGGKDYIVGSDYKYVYHCGKIAGSICNILTKHSSLSEEKKEELIKLNDKEKMIDAMSFDEFYDYIQKEL